MIKPFFEDTVVLFVKILSISVAECAVIRELSNVPAKR